MPPRRTTKRKYAKRRFTRKRAATASQRYKRALTIKKKRVSKLRKSLGVESKEIVAGISTTVKGNNSGSTAATGSPDATIIRLDPNASSLNILQGVRQDQRVGNKVKLLYGTIRTAMWPRSDAAGNTNNLQYIRMVCFYDKRNPTSVPTPFANLDFFQQSSATGYTGFTGTMYDLVNQINTDRYHVFWERTYKLGPAVLTGSSDADPAFANQANNDFKAFYKRTFSLTKTCVKNLTYTDNSAVVQWRGCYLMCWGVAASSIANTADINVANLQAQIRWRYSDA